jgi:hypothetical protein
MWVAELACEHGHRFEGWFGSRDDFDDQQRRGLVACPHCGSHRVDRCLTAPRLNLGGGDAPAPSTPSAPSIEAESGATAASAPLDPATLLRLLVAQVRAHTEDVGPRFAAEARRIHAQQAPERAIRGQASADEVAELRDEGIEVWALPALDADHRTH